MVLASSLSAEEVKLTVRPDGQGKNSLSGALDEVARLRAESGGTKKSILIGLEPGDYFLREGLTLDSTHSGAPEAPTILQSSEPRKARLLALRPLKEASWRPIEDAVLRARLPAEGAAGVVAFSWTNLTGGGELPMPKGVFIGSGGLPTLLRGKSVFLWPAGQPKDTPQ